MGPYFFEDDDGSAVTLHLLVTLNELNELAADVEDIWFQQDGATTHTVQRTMRNLTDLFPRHVISHRDDISWPALSPDFAVRFLTLGIFERGSIQTSFK